MIITKIEIVAVDRQLCNITYAVTTIEFSICGNYHAETVMGPVYLPARQIEGNLVLVGVFTLICVKHQPLSFTLYLHEIE